MNDFVIPMPHIQYDYRMLMNNLHHKGILHVTYLHRIYGKDTL